MGNLSFSSRMHRIVVVVVILFLLGVLAFLAWHRFMQWHEDRVDSAVRQERQKQEQKREQIEQKQVLDWLEKKSGRRESEELSESRMREVFGEPVLSESPGMESRSSSCRRLERKIEAFFAYLDKKRNVGSRGSEQKQKSYDVFEQILADLIAKPPLINDETRDLVSLMRNQAHFFRTLNKQRVELVLEILQSEKDVVEPAMADFYDYYVYKQCCRQSSKDCISEESLYRYAGFFLDTLSGKSYLMRRHPVVRTLIRYYSVLILDLANEQGLNRHGIDIRPHIKLVLNDVAVQEDLIFQQRYIRQLRDLQEKYQF